MKKGFKYYGITWLIAVVIFNAFVFITPNPAGGYSKFGGAFWAGYVLIMLALSGQAVCSWLFFKKDDKNKIFLSLSALSFSLSGLIVSIIAGVLCMIVPNLPNWLGALFGILELGAYGIAYVAATASAEAVESIDKKVEAKTMFIRSLTSDIESLKARAKSETVKAEVKKVSDAVRYSDPMSSEALFNVETQIISGFNRLVAAVEADDEEAAKTAADETVILIKDRSNKCKLLK